MKTLAAHDIYQCSSAASPEQQRHLAACAGCRFLASCDTLWRRLCRQHFGAEEPGDSDPVAAVPGFWLDLYKFNHGLFQHLIRSSRPGDTRFSNGPLVVQLA